MKFLANQSFRFWKIGKLAKYKTREPPNFVWEGGLIACRTLTTVFRKNSHKVTKVLVALGAP
jgi:hypothetical protein